MSRFFSTLLLVLGAALAALPARATVRVVATVPDLAAVAREVGGAHVQVDAMALPTQDPHFVDARPNLALALSRADVLLLQGVSLEVGWLPTLLTGARNPRIQPGQAGYVDCSRFVTLMGQATGPVDRSQGDIHPGGNPHYTYDPRAMIQVVQGIAGSLSQVDPEHAATYTSNAADLVGRLQAGITRWQGQLAGLKGVPVIAYHRSLTYLADFSGLEVVTMVEPKPGIPPTPAHVAQVLKLARSRGVKAVLQEPWYPTTTTKLVADKAGAGLVVLHAGTNFAGGQDYVAHMDELVAQLAQVAP